MTEPYAPPEQLMKDLRESIEMTIRAYQLPVELGWVFILAPLEQQSTAIRFATQGIQMHDSAHLCHSVGEMLVEAAAQQEKPEGKLS